MRDCEVLYLSLYTNSYLNMANKELNRLKVVLAEKKRTNKWLGEQLGKDKNNHIKMVYQYLSARFGQSYEDSQTA